MSYNKHEPDSTQPSPLHGKVVKKAKPGLLRALIHVWALWPQRRATWLFCLLKRGSTIPLMDSTPLRQGLR